MTRNAKVALLTVIGIPAIVAIAGLSSATYLCACMDAEQNFRSKVHAKPDTDVNDKLFMVLPRGSKLQQGEEFLEYVYQRSPLPDDSCVRTQDQLSCRYHVSTDWWGNRKCGFDVHLWFEAPGLSDAQVRPYCDWGDSGARPHRDGPTRPASS